MAEFDLTERAIMRTSPQWLRNIRTIGSSFSMLREQFAALLEGKIVLDVGSGFNGLAIDVAVSGINCEVHSLDPTFGSHEYEEMQKMALASSRKGYFPDIDPEDLEQARLASLKRRYNTFAHDMSAIPSNTFDLIIDHMAVFGYLKDENRDLPAFRQTLREECRVLKPGKEIYVTDFELYKQPDALTGGHWKEVELIRQGVNYRSGGAAYSIIISNV